VSATASTPNQTPGAKEKSVDRTPGWSVRLKLTLSYAGFLVIAGGLLLGAVWVFLLRYVPRGRTVLGRRDEFRDLADAFDAMLARLEAHVAEQQRFAANASHELRTPLAITQTLLDVARNDPDREDSQLVDRLT
jgi:two-component system sensor histidine kinase VanS